MMQILKQLRFGALTAVVGLAAVGCGELGKSYEGVPQATAAEDTFGGLNFELSFDQGVTAGAVNYSVVSLATNETKAGVLNLHDPNQAFNLFIGGLAPDYYEVTLSTVLNNGELCEGSQTVWVAAGEPVDIHIVMLCRPVSQRSGLVNIEGELAFPESCNLASLFIYGLEAHASYALSATATTRAGELRYRWKGPGVFDKPRESSTQYQCAPGGGLQRIELGIGDEQGCIDLNGADVDCGEVYTPTTPAPALPAPTLPGTSCSTCGNEPDTAPSTATADVPAAGGSSPSASALQPQASAPDGGAAQAQDASAGVPEDRCSACQAQACASERAACNASAECLAVESCVYRTECIYEQRTGATAGLWDACFCGIGANIDACYFDGAEAVGPCVDSITLASGADDNLSIGQAYYSEDTALGLAGWLQFCQANSCGADCGY